MADMRLGLLLPNQGVVFGAVTVPELLQMAEEAEPQGYYNQYVKRILDMHLVKGGHVESTLSPNWYDLYNKAADGNRDSYFRSSGNLRSGDSVSLVLTRKQSVKQIKVITGSPDFAKDILQNGVLEISANGETFKQVSPFKDGLAEVQFDTSEEIKTVRLRATADQAYPLIVREIILE